MRPRRYVAAAVAAAAAVVLAACSSGGGSSSSTGSAGTASGNTAAQKSTAYIGGSRCAQNQAAGQITYLTSYDLGGSVAILNEIAAAELGYFKDLCLNVTLKPEATNNAQLVSAGTAQIAGAGSASDVLSAIANGAKIKGIATYGNVGQYELATMANGPIKSLKDLVGKTVGYKTAMPPQLTSMLINAGVDVSKIKEVSVGFDPDILPQGKVDAVQVYKDHEPDVLRGQGYKITEWDPSKYGVQGTFSVMMANTAFAQAHPTAVEDFMRASFQAMQWINASTANLSKAIGWSKSMSQAGYSVKEQTDRWIAGNKIVQANLIPGHGIGYQEASKWEPEAKALFANKLIKQPADAAAAQDDTFVDAIYAGAKLIWPAPGAVGNDG
jgi:putative hydroxymethylpyrimidine transport system substrate-binding protein